MADFVIGSATSLSFAASANQALGRLGRAAGAAARAPAGEIPSGLEATRSGGGVTLNTADARTAVDVSLLAGFEILNALRTLRDAFQLASASGLTSPSANLTLDGNRISGVTITAQGTRLLQAIDRLVESAGTAGANLIQSNGRRVTIQTTRFGGRITVTPQPLDGQGLGLLDLSAISRQDATAAVARIDGAIAQATARLANLEVLRDSLAPGGAVSNELTRLVNANTTFLPRGSLVNQIA